MLDRLETYWREMLLQSSELCIFQMHQGCQDCVGGRCHSYWLCLHYWNSNISSFWLQVFCLQMNNESSNLIILTPGIFDCVFCLLAVGIQGFSGLRAKGEGYTNNDRRPNHCLCSFSVGPADGKQKSIVITSISGSLLIPLPPAHDLWFLFLSSTIYSSDIYVSRLKN